jgi:hypothetical protein
MCGMAHPVKEMDVAAPKGSAEQFIDESLNICR